MYSAYTCTNEMLEHDGCRFGWPSEEENGFCYIVTAVDYASKWVEAEPICDKSALSVAQVLVKLLCRYLYYIY